MTERLMTLLGLGVTGTVRPVSDLGLCARLGDDFASEAAAGSISAVLMRLYRCRRRPGTSSTREETERDPGRRPVSPAATWRI